MADAKTILQKYVSDMLSLESHIAQAIDKQVKENKDNPEVNSKFEVYSRTVQNHVEQLSSRLERLGGAANSPIKEGVAAALGVAAGVIDKFRSEEVSKNFRDDFTALNLSLISYEMLHTTALSLGDMETADLAARNVKDNADFVMEIQKLIPQVVLSELKKNHEVTPDESAVNQTKELVSNIWKS
jgi:ferritin-like metal-binding protein YciE